MFSGCVFKFGFAGEVGSWRYMISPALSGQKAIQYQFTLVDYFESDARTNNKARKKRPRGGVASDRKQSEAQRKKPAEDMLSGREGQANAWRPWQPCRREQPGERAQATVAGAGDRRRRSQAWQFLS